MELIFSDLDQVAKKVPQLQRRAKSRDADVLKELAILEKVQA